MPTAAWPHHKGDIGGVRTQRISWKWKTSKAGVTVANRHFVRYNSGDGNGISHPAVAGQEIKRAPVSCLLNPTENCRREGRGRIPWPCVHSVAAVGVVGLLAMLHLYHRGTRTTGRKSATASSGISWRTTRNIISVNIEGAKLYGEFEERAIFRIPTPSRFEQRYPKLKKKFVTISAADGRWARPANRVLSERLKRKTAEASGAGEPTTPSGC